MYILTFSFYFFLVSCSFEILDNFTSQGLKLKSLMEESVFGRIARNSDFIAQIYSKGSQGKKIETTGLVFKSTVFLYLPF